MTEDVRGFLDRAKHLADIVMSAGSVAIVSHIDADGISSAAIAKKALERRGIEPRMNFVRSLGDTEMDAISRMKEDVIWVCDLGAGSSQRLHELRCIITDHHQVFGGGQSRLDIFYDMDHMLNPILFDMNGSTYLSGAGSTYFVAREMDPRNTDLAYLAVVGAVGDMQDRLAHRLCGPLHDMVIEDALRENILEVVPFDLPFFGWVTRSAAAMLAFSNDLKALGYNDTIKQVASMFYSVDVPLKRTSEPPASKRDRQTAIWRSWLDLEQEEKGRVKLALRDRLEELGIGGKVLDGMLGDVYLFPNNPPGSPTREAKEFATLLNASGRYILVKDGKEEMERGKLIINVCLDPKVYSDKALENLNDHKANIREGMNEVHKVEQMTNVQYLLPNRKNSYCLKVNDTILGIITGMVLDQKNGSAPFSVDPQKPLVALAEKEDSSEMGKDPVVKVSVRMNRELTKKGVNLGVAINQATMKVGGDGGGHDVAAGANISRKQIKKFLIAMDEEVGEQISRFSPSK